MTDSKKPSEPKPEQKPKPNPLAKPPEVVMVLDHAHPSQTKSADYQSSLSASRADNEDFPIPYALYGVQATENI
ncbi:hypothetical protein [Pseudomonas veronii]|uniref:Uncharacterized protein n=1 Tax=Pseudomonas veronii TaxID=76761 RepID=A0A5Q2U8N4_PSEVE|nr:hypothetical protein [Pseudomonas veronii]QGH43269.1 hypothetical protein E4167_34800 [Pseudomonas veronii]